VAAGVVAATFVIGGDSRVRVARAAPVDSTGNEIALTHRESALRIPIVVISVIICAVGTGLLADAGAVARTLDRVATSDRGLIYTLGFLGALFPGGALIGFLTRRWSTAIEALLREKGDLLPQGLEGAGRYIGWLERKGSPSTS